MLISELDWKHNATHISVAIVEVKDAIAIFSFDAGRATYDVAFYPESNALHTKWAGLDILAAQCVLFEIAGHELG